VEASTARVVVDDDPDFRRHVFFDQCDLEALAGWRQSPRCCGVDLGPVDGALTAAQKDAPENRR